MSVNCEPGAPEAPTASTSITTRPPLPAAAWFGVLVLAATSFSLVVAEFLPPWLLTEMSASLGVSPGQAGQTVTVTAFAGLVVAPTIGLIFPTLDRRRLLAGLAVAAAISNVLVAITPNLLLLLIARLLLGAAVGGFWAMSIAVASQLVSTAHVGRAMMIVNVGTTMATVAGIPLGVFLGSLLDWRAVFGLIAALTSVVAIALIVVLPRIEPADATGVSALVETLRVPGLRQGLTGHVLVVGGHFAAFTYVRAALEEVSGFDANTIAAALAVFGIGGLLGNLGIGMIVDRHLEAVRLSVPLVLAASIAALADSTAAVFGTLAVWGFVFGSWLMLIATWAARIAPSRVEAAGGLVVAGFQLAIMLGAALGGLLVDAAGERAGLAAAAATALVGAVLFGTARAGRAEQPARSEGQLAL